MEAAEKIPKKLYVYLDTTRGAGAGHRRTAVYGGRTGSGVRNLRQRDLWRGAVDRFTVLAEEGPVQFGPALLLYGERMKKLAS